MSLSNRDSSDLSDRIDAWFGGSFAVAHRVLIAVVAVALVILACLALWDTVATVAANLAANDPRDAITEGVDTVFLTIILLELLHTVINREPLAQQAQDFIVIGLTSAIRYGLGVVATASSSSGSVSRAVSHHVQSGSGPATANPRDTVINLAINSASVLLLVAALWLVRYGFSKEPDDAV